MATKGGGGAENRGREGGRRLLVERRGWGLWERREHDGLV